MKELDRLLIRRGGNERRDEGSERGRKRVIILNSPLFIESRTKANAQVRGKSVGDARERVSSVDVHESKSSSVRSSYGYKQVLRKFFFSQILCD